MVKTVLGHNRGLVDWLIQRVSAIAMIVYIIALVAYLIVHPHLSYPEWHYLFSHAWMRIGTILFILLLLYHAWIGIWTVLTDYIKPYLFNILLQVIVLFALAACFIASLQIVWGI